MKTKLAKLGITPFTDPAGGMFLWCQLPNGCDAADVARLALAENVVLAPGNAFSVSGAATDLSFVLTDGTSEIRVHSTVAPTRSFREGSGAVVEGRLGADAVFEASQVIVKHDEHYVAPSGSAVPSNYFDPGSDS